jgi:hypothetical protein
VERYPDLAAVAMGPVDTRRVSLLVHTPHGLRRRGKVAAARFVRLHGRHGFADEET